MSLKQHAGIKTFLLTLQRVTGNVVLPDLLPLMLQGLQHNLKWHLL